MQENDDDIIWFEREYDITYGQYRKICLAIWVMLG